VFALSFAIAALPSLSYDAGQGKMKNFIKTFSKTFRQILFYIIPSSILFLVLRAQIVRVVLGTGNFDWSDTYLTAQALGIFSVSLFAQGLVPLITRGFYALHNTIVPFIVAAFTVVVNVVLSLLFTGIWDFFGIFSFEMGVLGLVLAYAVANLLHLGILLVMFHVRVGELDDVRIIRSTVKIGSSAFIAGLCAYGMLYLLAPVLDTRTGVGILLQGLLAGLVGVTIYFGMTLALRTPEAELVLHRVRLSLHRIESWLSKKK
jgi:putative peptidoglycan lipid II flippase